MALDPPASLADETAAENDTGAPERTPVLAGSVPPEAFPPSRDWKAGGDLLGTPRVDKARYDDPAVADQGAADPCIVLDESKDLLVISDSACLGKLLAAPGLPDREELQDQPGDGESWTGAVVREAPIGREPDGEALARAADWIEW